MREYCCIEDGLYAVDGVKVVDTMVVLGVCCGVDIESALKFDEDLELVAIVVFGVCSSLGLELSCGL